MRRPARGAPWRPRPLSLSLSERHPRPSAAQPLTHDNSGANPTATGGSAGGQRRRQGARRGRLGCRRTRRVLGTRRFRDRGRISTRIGFQVWNGFTVRVSWRVRGSFTRPQPAPLPSLVVFSIWSFYMVYYCQQKGRAKCARFFLVGQFAPGISTIVSDCTDPLVSITVNRTLASVCGADKWFL